MCVDAKSSLNTFFIGFLSGITLIHMNDSEIGMFIISISLMQLAEYFMWKDMNCENGLNKLGNILGIICIYLQIFNFKVPHSYYNWIVIFFMLTRLCSYVSKGQPCSTETNKGHLEWGSWDLKKNDAYSILLVLAYFFFLFIKDLGVYSTLYKLLYVLSLIYTLNISGSNVYDVTKWSSLWCYIGNLLGPILIALKFFQKAS